jgi:hypothetical protein
VLGGRILCRGGGPVGHVWDEDEHVELINVILNVCLYFEVDVTIITQRNKSEFILYIYLKV